MRKSLLIFLVAIFATSIAFADNIDKLSAGTQMFLSERRGEIKLPRLKDKRTVADLQQAAGDSLILFKDEQLMKKRVDRKIAEAEMVNGVEMISAFVKVKSGGFSAIEAMGAVMQTKFNDNLAAMMLPADKIEKIADLDNVIGIEVAEVLQPLNDLQRSVTQAGDAISNSAAARALGLTKQYTGKNVILGVIDTGIDFTHIAFKDKNGNTRIKRAYKLSGSNSTSLTTYSSASQIASLTYDTNAEDHGTHTSTTAGGSSVIVNGSTVTVTDDHANATYGGMAPEADLVLAGLSSLYTTSIGTAIQNICNYADEVGKPCVISLSLGSQVGPHDGTGTIASIVNQYAGNNHIIVYAASNDGMRATPFVEMGTSNGGGMYASGTSTSSKPMLANVQRSFSNADGNYQLYMPTITAYARTANVATSLRFHVVNVNTGAIVYSSDAYTTGTTISLTGSTGLAQYFNSSTSWSNQYGDYGKIRITRTQDSNNKYYWQIYAPIMQTTSGSTSGSVATSNYALCVSVYPTSTNSSTIIDMWENTYCWFGADLTLSSTYANNYNLVQGNDECSVSDNATYSKVISVGAYVTKNSITDYNGTSHDYSSDYPNIGDHAYFSSWQTAGYGPLGTALPHINAPGARIVAGVNHYHTKSVDDYSYWSDDYIADLVVNNSNYPYAAMEGTSMATPCASGIIAQWLQACVEAGKTPTPDYIKEVMAATWDTDQWTNGAGHGAKTFGTHGKINAIKGIQYILGATSGPTITATPTSIDFGNVTAGTTTTQTFTVTGENLEGNISLSKSGNNYTIDKTSISKNSDGSASATVTVTFAPTANVSQTYTGTVTLTSSNASSVTVSLTGKGVYTAPAITANPTSLSFTGNSGTTYTKTVTVTGTNLQGNITAAISGDANGFYSVSPTTITSSNGSASRTVTVTWAPTAGGTSTANLVLTTTGTGASSVTVPITGTAQGPTITANPTSVTFTGAYATRTYTQAVTVTGTNLTQNITASISGANVYSIDNTSLTTTGGTITVTYAPIAAGNTTATLTLSSTGASSVTVPITGTAQAATPTLIVSPSALSFTDSDRTKTFAVTGRFINEDVTLTLNDASGAFALGSATIPASSISETNAVNVTVNFTAEEEGDYTGTVTVASDGAASQTVNLNASISNGGTASDAYLNIAKYATIDEAGATVSGMSSIYKYTEYADDACAWLTVSNYGALQADASQNWLETKSLNGYSNTWSATDIFLGNGSYFTSGGYSIYGSGNQIFYVTNCTQVKSMIKDGNANATLAIYECTKGSDGTLTAATTATDTKTGNCSSSSPNVITSSTIDASKIYKVVLTGGGSYPDLLEIGFKTPLNPLGMPAITNVDPTTTTAEVTWTSGENNVGWNLRYREYVEQENSTPFFESFENGLNEWTLVDTDGDGNNWRQFDPTNFRNSSYTAYDGQYVAMSRSWQNSTALTPDQWMISPQIEDLGGTLKYYIMDDGSYQEKYRIYVSTSGTDISSFQPVTEDMYSPASTSWTEVTIDLSQYAGKAGYIGFRHYDCSDEDFMLIDALGLYKGSEGEWIYINNVTSPYTINGLTPETTYEVQVQGIGDNGKTSSWTASTIFTTLGGISLAELELNGTVGTTYTISDELVAVDYAIVDDAIYLWCKDQGNASIAPAPAVGEKIDYLGNDQYAQNGRAWDESNWVALKFSVGSVQTAVTSITSAKGHKINAGTITGVYSDATNYTIAMPEGEGLPTGAVGDEFTYTPNVYCVANFNPAYLTEDGAQLKDNGNVYFFMTPKVQEVCEITYAYWNAENFIVPTTSGFVGSLSLDWTYNEAGNVTSQLNADNVYRFKTIVQRTGATTSLPALKAEGGAYKVAPLNLTSTSKADIPTAIGTVKAGVDVVDVYYVNSTGLMSKTPFQGVNIIVTRYSDGSRTTVKKVFK
ncbi:MAG: choice-of-anchor J domain-containing protein [Bacteroidales bacterium]|nr:choice-of-anchor J domain-containing protein [Bacteroidales bacterium]